MTFRETFRLEQSGHTNPRGANVSVQVSEARFLNQSNVNDTTTEARGEGRDDGGDEARGPSPRGIPGGPERGW